MSWWQIVLIIAGAVSVGVGAGYLANRLLPVIIHHSKEFSRKSPAAPRVVAPPIEKIVQGPVERASEVAPSVPDLFAEIEHNRRLASAEWNGELQPFQTRVWDNLGDEGHLLPDEIKNELTEAYSDMSLANSITWLSTEMARRSSSLDESYLRLRSSVAERLNKTRAAWTRPGQTAKASHYETPAR